MLSGLAAVVGVDAVMHQRPAARDDQQVADPRDDVRVGQSEPAASECCVPWGDDGATAEHFVPGRCNVLGGSRMAVDVPDAGLAGYRLARVAFALYGERLSIVGTAAVGLTMAGAAVVISRGDPALMLGQDWVAGDLWMLSAVVVYALYSVLLRKRAAVMATSLRARPARQSRPSAPAGWRAGSACRASPR